MTVFFGKADESHSIFGGFADSQLPGVNNATLVNLPMPGTSPILPNHAAETAAQMLCPVRKQPMKSTSGNSLKYNIIKKGKYDTP
jgi:hypothetical protein